MPPSRSRRSSLLVLVLVSSGALAACAKLPVTTDGDDNRKVASDCAGEPFSEAYMRRVIGTLAQPAWAGRRFDSDGLKAATKWVRDQFACIGLTPGAPALAGLPASAFEQPFETDGDEIEPATDISDYTYDPERKYTFTNVIGSIPGRGALADEVVVIGAHVDHMGSYGKEGGAMVLGADDDASGVLALMSIAKQLLHDDAQSDRRTLVFAAWGIEEDPFYVRGSKAFFEALDASAKARLVYYVNFDMVGGYRYHGNVNVLGTYDGSPARRLMEAIAADHPDLQTDLGERGSSSDHVTFCENGVPYAFFWTQDDCYHEACDTPDAIDYAQMRTILQMATELANRLATEPDLATAKAGFADAYAAAWPGKTCAEED